MLYLCRGRAQPTLSIACCPGQRNSNNLRVASSSPMFKLPPLDRARLVRELCRGKMAHSSNRRPRCRTDIKVRKVKPKSQCPNKLSLLLSYLVTIWSQSNKPVKKTPTTMLILSEVQNSKWFHRLILATKSIATPSINLSSSATPKPPAITLSALSVPPPKRPTRLHKLRSLQSPLNQRRLPTPTSS